MIPPRLQSTDAPSLIEVFHFEEPWVQDGHERLQKSLEVACLGPNEFLETLRVYEPLLRREPAALVERFFKEEVSDEAVQEAIAEEMRLQRELWRLPEVMDVGMFQVTTKAGRLENVLKSIEIDGIPWWKEAFRWLFSLVGRGFSSKNWRFSAVLLGFGRL